MTVLRFIHQQPFGVVDPVFGRDVAYYVFTVPLVTSVLRALSALTMVSLIASVLIYLMRRDVSMIARNVTIEPAARWHLASLVAALFLLTALRIQFVRLPGLLHADSTTLTGANLRQPAWHPVRASPRGAGRAGRGGLCAWKARGAGLARGALSA